MSRSWWLVFALVAACGGGEEIGSSTLSAAWTFESGDCASNGVETVRITWTEQGGASEQADFPCTDGSGDLGEIAEGGGTYDIKAEGLDAEGVVRAENFGQSVTFNQGRAVGPVDVTLRPKSSNVVVRWNRCPTGVILPYFVSLYEPGDGTELGAKVTEVQESCSSGEATLMNVRPGDFVAEVDSRAVTPALRGTAPVTVVAGEDAEVNIDL